MPAGDAPQLCWSYATYCVLNNARALISAEGEIAFKSTGAAGVWETTSGVLSQLKKAESGYVWFMADATKRYYNAAGWLVRVEHPRGGFSIERDATGLAKSLKDLGKKSLTFTVENNRYAALTDPAGSEWKYQFDAKGNLSGVARPAGGKETFGYDEQGVLTLANIGFGNVSLRYDEQGRVVEQKSGDVILERRSYSETGGALEVKLEQPIGQTSVFHRSADGRRFETVGGGQLKTTVTTDARGQILSLVTDGETVFAGTPDVKGLYRVIKMGGLTLGLVWSPAGQLTKLTGIPDLDLEQSFDSANRLKNVRGSDGAVVSFEWNSTGQCLRGRAQPPQGAPEETIEVAYDTQGNVKALSIGQQTIGVTADAVGRISSIMIDGKKGAFTYDAESLPTGITGDGKQVLKLTYDSRGLPLTIGGEQGEVSLNFGLDGRLTGLKDLAGGNIGIQHDTFGRIQQVINQTGKAFRFEYDDRGMLKQFQMPGGQGEELSYDAQHRLVSRARPTGAKVQYQYVDETRIARIDAGALGTVDMAYGPDKTLSGWTDSTGEQVGFLPNKAVYRNTAVSNVEVSTETAPDAYGLVQTVAVTGQDPIKRTFDRQGHLAKIETAAGKFNITYDSAGRRAALAYPNGVTTTYAYTDAGQIASLTTVDAKGATLDQWKYAYDSAGRCTRIDGLNDQSRAFSYDAAGQLAKVTDAKGAELERYAYDASGNRTLAVMAGQEQPVKSDEQGRLLSQGATTFAYDAFGRRGSEAVPGGVMRQFTYDSMDRLIKAQAGEATVTHGYSVSGNRLWTEKTGEAKRFYLYAGADVAAEIDAQGKVTASYVYGAEIDEALASRDAQGAWTYHHRDPLQTLKMVTDAGGKKTASFTYSAFGTPQEKSAVQYRYLFAGRDWDPVAGQYFNRARWYDPQTGQFTTVDPTGLKGGLNPYVYCSNDPVQFRDPSGTVFPLIIIIAGGAILGGVLDYAGQAITAKIKGEPMKKDWWKSVLVSTIFGGATAGLGTVYTGVKAAMVLAGCADALKTLVVAAWEKGKLTLGDALDALVNGLLSTLTAGLFEKYIGPLISPTLRKFFYNNLRPLYDFVKSKLGYKGLLAVVSVLRGVVSNVIDTIKGIIKDTEAYKPVVDTIKKILDVLTSYPPYMPYPGGPGGWGPYGPIWVPWYPSGGDGGSQGPYGPPGLPGIGSGGTKKGPVKLNPFR